MNAAEEKNALRREILARREALGEAYRAEADERIRQAVRAYAPWREAGSVFLYVSVPGEPDTRALLAEALREGRRVFVPRCLKGGAMRAVRIHGLPELVPGRFGIPEPVSAEETAGPDGPDLILVPCLTVARDGTRLGHGGGYYDRFLAPGAGRALCLCYGRLLSDFVPASPTDVRIPAVATEDGIFRTGA